METSSICTPGFTIAALALASGTSFLDAAFGVASVLGGIAGPVAGIEGAAGDLVHPGLNLVAVGRDHAPWRRLEELLLGPVDACQRMMRDLSRAANPERLDHLQFSHVGDNTQAIAERSRAALFGSPSAPLGYVDDRRHLAVLHTPSFVLHGPDADTFAKAMPEIMDAHAFLVYEDLFTQLLAKGVAKDKCALGSRLAAAVVGHDEFSPRGKRIGPGSLDTVRANLLATTTREQVGEALTGDHEAAERILRHSIILEPSTIRPAMAMEPQNLKWGYSSYYRSVRGVLDARRAGVGFQIAPKPEVHADLHAFTTELQDWCQSLPIRLRPYFSGALSLPYRLCWTLMATLAPGESDAWVLPFTLAATRQIKERQRVFLDGLLTDAETAERRRARITMLWKLADKPLSMRDLMRRFTVQKREVHEPVLGELIGEQMITRHPDGLLELTAQGRSHMAA